MFLDLHDRAAGSTLNTSRLGALLFRLATRGKRPRGTLTAATGQRGQAVCRGSSRVAMSQVSGQLHASQLQVAASADQTDLLTAYNTGNLHLLPIY